MKRLFQLLLIVLTLQATAQSKTDFDEQIKLLRSCLKGHKSQLEKHQVAIDSLEKEITNLVNRRKLLEYNTEDRFRVPSTTKREANLRVSSDVLSKTIATIPNESRVWVLAFKEGYYMVEYQGYVGYTHQINIKESEPVIALKEVISEVERKLMIEKDKKYLDSLTAWYEANSYSGAVNLGMPGYDVHSALGPPKHTTTQETVFGTTRYMHYSDRLIVVRNGTVVSITYK